MPLPQPKEAEIDGHLHDLFGSDSDSEGPECSGSDDSSDAWLRDAARQRLVCFPNVPGLRVLRGFLSDERQGAYFNTILEEGWVDRSEGGANQSMCFHTIPDWARELMALIPLDLFPAEVRGRMPLFNQIIINLYRPGEGIKSHVDLMRFCDGICSVSLGAPILMDFTKVEATGEKVSVWLEPGDLLAMSGEARFGWEHGIEGRDADVIDGTSVTRGTRISVTFRSLLPGDAGHALTELADGPR